MKHKATLFYLIVAAQVLFLLVMIAVKQSTLIFGVPILLKPVPVDPVDLFRGDFIDIRYEISTLTNEQAKESVPVGASVYVKLTEGDNSVWEAEFFSKHKVDEPYIKGIVEDKYTVRTYTIEEDETKEIRTYEERRFDRFNDLSPQINDRVEMSVFDGEVNYIRKCDEDCQVDEKFRELKFGAVIDIKESKTTYEIQYPIQSYFVQKNTGTPDELRDEDNLLIEVYLWRGDAIVSRILYDEEELNFS